MTDDIGASLLRWYDANRRALPWRALPGECVDPYRVWLSEIMLQQTTVVTVAPYFEKFVQRWPTVHALADAEREDVLRLWAGLGYYRRAHNLHEAARVVAYDLDGRFPESEQALLALPGCGPYTAAAIAAIAFDKPANVVDGNVERVVARLFAVKAPLPRAKKELKDLASGLLPHKRFGDYAQALMDLGATVCTPRSPKCGACPLAQRCKARGQGLAEQLPAPAASRAKPVRRAYGFVVRDRRGRILLCRRPLGDLLGGMTGVPMTAWIEGSFADAQKAMPRNVPQEVVWRPVPGSIRHVFTHFILEIRVLTASISGRCNGKWTDLECLEQEALPSLMRKIVRHGLAAGKGKTDA